MKPTKNPYREGSTAYIAWELGYLQALDDVMALDGEDQEEGDQE